MFDLDADHWAARACTLSSTVPRPARVGAGRDELPAVLRVWLTWVVTTTFGTPEPTFVALTVKRSLPFTRRLTFTTVNVVPS